MENKQWGVILVILGMLGMLLWYIGADILFQYLITEVYNGDPGEPIWVLAPEYAILVLVPVSLFLFGLCVLLHAATPV